MQVNELSPFKNTDVYQTAKKTFPPVGKKGLKKQDDKGMALDAFNKFLTDNGFKKLGTGSFGTVFESPNYPWVFKLFYNDPAYFKFFEFARANQSNPYLPTIKGKYIRLNKGVYVIRLEKLEKLGYNSPREFPALDHLLNIITAADFKREMAQVKKIDPKLADTIGQISKLLGNDFEFDLHSGNLMKRGNQLVITDPIYSPELNMF